MGPTEKEKYLFLAFNFDSLSLEDSRVPNSKRLMNEGNWERKRKGKTDCESSFLHTFLPFEKGSFFAPVEFQCNFPPFSPSIRAFFLSFFFSPPLALFPPTARFVFLSLTGFSFFPLFCQIKSFLDSDFVCSIGKSFLSSRSSASGHGPPPPPPIRPKEVERRGEEIYLPRKCERGKTARVCTYVCECSFEDGEDFF